MFRVQTLKAVTGVLLATSMLAGAPIAQAATGTRGAQAEITTASANLADREQRGNWQSGRNDRSSAQRAERSQQRPSGGYERASRSSSESRPVRSTGESRSAERSGRDWNRSSRRSETAQTRSGGSWGQANRSETAQTRSGRDWNRSDRSSSETIRPSRTVERNAQTDRTWSGRTNSGDGDRLRNVRDRNTSYRDRDRSTSYRDRTHSNDRTHSTDRNGSYRDGYRDGISHDRDGSWRDGHRDGHRDRERWNTRWRENDRYDWHRYRTYNRDIYRMGRYYAPYRGYSYSRLYVGFSLGSLFYSSRYWINDPWRYRLPEAYGGYRWVRYYDDALLVDTYSGEVVDVIYDFFW